MTPISEFSTFGLASIVSTALSPNSKVDLKRFSTLKKIDKSDTDFIPYKLKHFIKFIEYINGKWRFCFDPHPKFGS